MNERFGEAASERPASGFMSGGGESGALMRACDWSTSALGEPASWPQSLRTVVSVVLKARQPMFAAWGPDLAFLYNDDYAPIFGARHPGAMGRPFADVWSDIWSQIEPLVRRTLAGEASFHDNLLIPMQRRSGPEDAWFTFSYTPLEDEAGAIAGMLCVATETTRQVLAERHMAAERERLASLFDQAPSFMAFLQGPNYTIELANPAYLRLTDMRDILGKPFVEALPEAAEQGYLDLLDGVTASGQAYAATATRYAYRAEPGGPLKERFVDFLFQPILGPDGTVTGVFVEGSDVTERKRAEDHLHLMVNELNHRVKNSLATVQAIAAQTFRDPSRFEHSKKEFSARILALANAHDVLTEENWVGASLRQVIERTVGPHGDDTDKRFGLEGPHVLLTPKTALALSMALHELCTNATKYGSLSLEGGQVGITWTVAVGADGPRLRLRWIERGGPPVGAPKRKGFGSRLIERTLAGELDGEVAVEYGEAGVSCVIDCPLPPIA